MGWTPWCAAAGSGWPAGLRCDLMGIIREYTEIFGKPASDRQTTVVLIPWHRREVGKGIGGIIVVMGHQTDGGVVAVAYDH